MKYILIIIVSLSLFSCQDMKKEKQIAQVSQLIKTVDSIQTVFLAKRNDSISKIINAVFTVELRIKKNYYSDTVNVELGKKINEYKMVRKRLKPVGKQFSQINDGVLEEQNVLINLKKDIETNAGEKGKYDEYITFESKKVGQLKQVLTEMLVAQEKCVSTFNRLHPEMNNFSLSLIKK
jgi:hypothetical protein